MFRLVDNAFEDNEKLHNLAVYCVTESIKANLKNYLDNEKELMGLFSESFINELKEEGIEPNIFINKKAKQLLKLLEDSEEHTPDIFIEYIIYKMMSDKEFDNSDIVSNELEEKIVELKNLLTIYQKEEELIEDDEYLEEFFDNPTIVSTNLVFWDWDFAYFDDWGFKKTIKALVDSQILRYDYGLEYTKKIFLDVNEELPLSLINNK